MSEQVLLTTNRHLFIPKMKNISLLGGFKYENEYVIFLTYEENDSITLGLIKTSDFTCFAEIKSIHSYPLSTKLKLLNLNGIFYILIHYEHTFCTLNIEPFINPNETTFSDESYSHIYDYKDVIDFTFFTIGEFYYILVAEKNEGDYPIIKVLKSNKYEGPYEIINDFGELECIDKTVKNFSSHFNNGILYVTYDLQIENYFVSKLLVFGYSEENGFNILKVDSVNKKEVEKAPCFILNSANSFFYVSIINKKLIKEYDVLSLPKEIMFEKGQIFKKPSNLIQKYINKVEKYDYSGQISSNSLLKIDAKNEFEIVLSSVKFSLKISYLDKRVILVCNGKIKYVSASLYSALSLFVLFDNDLIEIGVNKGKEFFIFPMSKPNRDLVVKVDKTDSIVNFLIGNFK